MKKYLLLTAMVLALAAPGLAHSQTPPGDWNQQPQGGPPQGGMPQSGPPAMNGQAGGFGGGNFQQHKAEILQRLNAHMAETQQRIRCVEAANDHQALHACMPPREGPGGPQNGPPRQ